MNSKGTGTIFPVIGLGVTQSWVGASAVLRRAELLRDFMLCCSVESLQKYVIDNPIYCVLGPGRVMYALDVDFCLVVLFLAYQASIKPGKESSRVFALLELLGSSEYNDELPFSVSSVELPSDHSELISRLSLARWRIVVVDDLHHLPKERFLRKLRSRGLISYTDVGHWLTVDVNDNDALSSLPDEHRSAAGPSEEKSGVVINGFSLDRAILPNSLFAFIYMSVDDEISIVESRDCAFISLSWAVGAERTDPGYTYPGWGNYHVCNDWAWKLQCQWKRFSTQVEPTSAVAAMQQRADEEAEPSVPEHWSVQHLNELLLGKELHSDVIRLAVQLAKLPENQHVPGYTGGEPGVQRALKTGLELQREETVNVELQVCGGPQDHVPVPRHHVDLYGLRPTQHCVGVASVVQKCKKQEKVLSNSGFSGLVRHLEQNPVPCVLASQKQDGGKEEDFLFFVIDHHHLLYALHLLQSQAREHASPTVQPSPVLTNRLSMHFGEKDLPTSQKSQFSPVQDDFFSYSYVTDTRVRTDSTASHDLDKPTVEPTVLSLNSPFMQLTVCELDTLQRCCVVFTRNLTNLHDPAVFWRRMDMEGLCYLRYRGRKSTFDCLPATIKGMHDDSMRALAWSVRKLGVDKNQIQRVLIDINTSNHQQAQPLCIKLLFQSISSASLTEQQLHTLHTNSVLSTVLNYAQEHNQDPAKKLEKILKRLTPGYLKLPTGFLEFQWGDFLRMIAKRRGRPGSLLYQSHQAFFLAVLGNTPSETAVWLANLLCHTPAAWNLPGHVKICESRTCLHNAMYAVLHATDAHTTMDISPIQLEQLIQSWVPMDEKCSEHADHTACYAAVCTTHAITLHVWLLTFQLLVTIQKL